MQLVMWGLSLIYGSSLQTMLIGILLQVQTFLIIALLGFRNLLILEELLLTSKEVIVVQEQQIRYLSMSMMRSHQGLCWVIKQYAKMVFLTF